jgi:hypothetical protein
MMVPLSFLNEDAVPGEEWIHLAESPEEHKCIEN